MPGTRDAAAPATKLPADALQKETTPTAKKEPEEPTKAVQSYCANIASAAANARHLHQKREIEVLRADIQKRADALDVRISELKSLFARRDEFLSKARDSIVSIYASMKSEAAAKHIASLDEETAAAILSRLDTRQSSLIMGDMEAEKAARLTEIIAGASSLPERVRSAQTSELESPDPSQGSEQTPSETQAKPRTSKADAAGAENP